MTLLVEDASGRRTLTGWIADNPSQTLLTRLDAMTFSLVVYCPDPNRYGETVCFPTSGGICRVWNEGNAPTWPRAVVSGHVTTLRLAMGDVGEVRWQGDSDGLELDFRDMIPSDGTIVKDLAFPIPPGSHPVTVSVDLGATVTMNLRPSWR